MILDYDKLYEPYCGKIPLHKTVSWLYRECNRLGISREIGEAALRLVFLELSEGRKFDTTGKEAGLPGLPHAVLNKYMLAKAKTLHDSASTAYTEVLSGITNDAIIQHIDRMNKEYIESVMPPKKKFMDIDRSWALKAGAWVLQKIGMK